MHGPRRGFCAGDHSALQGVAAGSGSHEPHGRSRAGGRTASGREEDRPEAEGAKLKGNQYNTVVRAEQGNLPLAQLFLSVRARKGRSSRSVSGLEREREKDREEHDNKGPSHWAGDTPFPPH